MKKTTILNAQLSHTIATMGHTDGLTICDAGLPKVLKGEKVEAQIPVPLKVISK